MPKKTKKQKLRADDRHKVFAPLPAYTPSVQSVGPSSTFQFTSTTRAEVLKNREDHQELTTIRADLLRTIILAILAVSAELFLYWRFFRIN